MTLKELIREHRTYDIELIVWNDKRNHVICNPFGLPHFDYYTGYGELTYGGLLTLTEDKILIDGGLYIDINQEIDYKSIDYYTLNQEEYLDWADCTDMPLEEVPEQALVIAVDPDCVRAINE